MNHRTNDETPVLISAPIEDGKGHMEARYAVLQGNNVAWTHEPLAATVFPSARVAICQALKAGVRDIYATVCTPDHTMPVNNQRLN